MDAHQLDFDFSSSPGGHAPELPGLFPDGLDRWHEERRAQREALARDLGLPLGHEVKLTLKSGPELQGKLVLATEQLWIERTPKKNRDAIFLAVDKAEFRSYEIASCVRLD